MAKIHPLAVVSPEAELGQDVVVGPFCVIEADTKIGDGCVLASHVVVKRGVVLGANNQVFEGTVIGGFPQCVRMPDKIGDVVIGDSNVIREHVTIHRAMHEGTSTRIGSHVFMMGGVHIAHDCAVADHVIMAQYATLGGHVTVGERAFVSGLVAVHQFCRIGRLAMVGGLSRIVQDVAPYVTIDGNTHSVVGLNRVGLKRSGFTPDDFLQVKAAYRLIFRSGLRWVDILSKLKAEFPAGPVVHLHEFLSTGSRGFVHESRLPKGATVPLDGDVAASAEPQVDPVLRVRAG